MLKSNPSLVVRRRSLAADVPLIHISRRTGKAESPSCRKKRDRSVATRVWIYFPTFGFCFWPTTDDRRRRFCTTPVAFMVCLLDRNFSSSFKWKAARIFREKISTNRNVLC